jgi:DNA repair protein RecN (Recombination protein N)
VAAFAHQQVSVRKEADQEVSTVRAEAVDGDRRVAEIARMLAGKAGGSTMHEAARELLASSGRSR